MRRHWSQTLNVVFVLGVTLILLGAYGVQFLAGELPCPLCLLQRLAFLGVGTGALLNAVFGVRPRYYGLSMVSALFGACVAGRQVLLHIAPGDPGFGSPLWGLHLYTWSLVAFALTLVILSVMFMLDGQFVPPDSQARVPLSRFARGVLLLFMGVALANCATTLLLCGWGPCPDDPTGYLLLSRH